MNLRKYIFNMLACLVLSGPGFLLTQGLQAMDEIPEADPAAVIETAAQGFIGALLERPLSSDEEVAKREIRELVEEHLIPTTDFRRIAYRTMGRYYREAETAQFLRFADAIKDNMINSYSGVLLGGDSQQLAQQVDISVRSTRRFGSSKDRARVRTWISISNTARFDLDYDLYWNKSRRAWLIENVTIEGINLVVNFRNQFQTFYNEYEGDIEQIIQIWATQTPNNES